MCIFQHTHSCNILSRALSKQISSQTQLQNALNVHQIWQSDQLSEIMFKTLTRWSTTRSWLPLKHLTCENKYIWPQSGPGNQGTKWEPRHNSGKGCKKGGFCRLGWNRRVLMNNVKLCYILLLQLQKKNWNLVIFLFSFILDGVLTPAFYVGPVLLSFLQPFTKLTLQYSYKENNLTFEHYQIIKIWFNYVGFQR